MSKIRINDLARELEVKSKAILDALIEVGVTEKKTHSSSLEEHEAALLRKHFRAHSEEASAASKSSRAARTEDEIKTKIDLSRISRPGDVLRAIQQKTEAVTPAPTRPAAKPLPTAPAATKREAPGASPAVKPSAPAKPVVEAPAPKFVTPASVASARPPAAVVKPPKPPATSSTPTSASAASAAVAGPARPAA
ncbi:MAG: translation initiation factor IF-2 N-terminal domain-containing protein, partial [Terriglobales bacterium]